MSGAVGEGVGVDDGAFAAIDVVLDGGLVRLKEVAAGIVHGRDEGGRCDSQVGTGDRSEKIRTYNFHQGRVTDHRIGLTLYKIDSIMDGDLDELIDALTTASQAEKLAGLETFA